MAILVHECSTIYTTTTYILMINDPSQPSTNQKKLTKHELPIFYQVAIFECLESLRIWSLKVYSSGILQRSNSTKDQ